MLSLKERWANKVELREGERCFFWMGAADPRGYGKIQVDGQLLYAHRVSYELHKGLIPEGMYIDHRCSTPNCVNPAHLDAVSPGDNVRRTYARGRGRNQHVGKTHCKRGHELTADNVYLPPNGAGRYCRRCGKIRQEKRKEKRRMKRAGY